ncbi:MAG: class I SAM-dependent RNA methyltransferase [Lachnospiraceae bacterium]|nr:class I SAM-dependent RNA methyltransferase [Lachnospiraceae bacterium]MDY4095483.1 class I SAM-dependent RNA methyltransferase [Lachnospiraceae bacterium]
MKKGQTYTGIVERVDFPNKGIVMVEESKEDGNTAKAACIVKNVLPGQKVTFTVNKVRKGKAEGRMLSVEEPSLLEVESPCPHFGFCGGCLYLTLPYEEQLKIKEKQVKRLLDSCLKGKQMDWIFEGIKASPAVYEYRNKMEFSFGDEVKDGPLSLGMHKRGSFYDVVTVDNCCIVDEDYRLILKTTLDFFREHNLSFYHRLRHEGYLRHLLVRKGSKTGEILAALVTTTQYIEEGSRQSSEGDLQREIEGYQWEEEKLLEGWKGRLLSLKLKGEIAGLLHLRNDSVADVVKSDQTQILYGRDYFYEELLGLKFKISTFSFFQTNSLGAEVLYQTAREYIGDLRSIDQAGKADKVVYDLYSGTGTIAQLMAPVAKKVIGVEIVEEAVKAAEQNAALNGLDNCRFIAGDVLKVLDTIEEKPDFIILDPPREGIHPKALEKIIDYGVERLIYISCKPTSLVRDLEVFLERGYAVERAVAVDQFPWTGNVETVCLLSNRKPDSYVHLNLKMEDYYRIKDAQKEQDKK